MTLQFSHCAAGALTLGFLFFLAPPESFASDLLLNGSSRIDYLYFRNAPLGLQTVMDDGSTNLDGWFDTRVFYGDWEASARLRIHESTRILGDSSLEEIDRRHIAMRRPDLEIMVGNYYTTFGNGLILRAIEQRFVSLNRVNRPLELDRNLDGVRLKGERGPLRLTLISGTPKRQGISQLGAPSGGASDDLLQGGEAVLVSDRGELGVSYVQSDMVDSSQVTAVRRLEDLASYRGRVYIGPVIAEAEYVEQRPQTPGEARGQARYARLEGAVGSLGWTVEAKDYRDFDFEHNQPPTLVRTHESTLLNRGTHVLLTDDERGVQAEVIYAPDLHTSVLINLAGSEGVVNEGREFREVYLEARSESPFLGAARVGLDWSRDLTKFPGIENRWTMALELERFLDDGNSVIVDMELQTSETSFGKTTRQFLQFGFSRAGRWTATLSGEHSNDRMFSKRDWLFASLDIRISDRHDLTLGYGTRPAGIVCSGGFCFESPAFDGAEFRLLSRF